MKMRSDYNHATGRWEITDTDAIPPSTFAEVSDEARTKLLANAANNFAPMLAALEALIAAADREAAILKAGEAAGKSDKDLDDELGAAIVDRVLAEEKARAAIKAAKEGA